MTVRKIERRGASRWVIEIPYADRRTGKRVRFRKDADVQTSAAAHAEERRLIGEHQQLGYIRTARDKRHETASAAPAEGTTPTFAEAYKTFSETKAITRLKATTRRSYDVSVRTYLLPRWKDILVGELGFVDFERLNAHLKSLKLKPSTRANVINAGRSILRCCIDAGTLPFMPRLPRNPKGGETVVTPPSEQDVDAVLAAANKTARLALALCSDAGLRAGEVRGLEWQDIDLVGRTLTVRQTIYHGEKDTPKSGHQRKVPLTDRLYGLLFEAAKRPHRLTGPVAPTSNGTIWAESSLDHAFKAVLRRIKLPRSKLHALRHFFVTRCFRVGGGAPTIQALAGHRHMQVTARYAHTDEAAKREVIAAWSSVRVQNGQQMVNSPSGGR